jgi:hypothetical protein
VKAPAADDDVVAGPGDDFILEHIDDGFVTPVEMSLGPPAWRDSQ